MPSATPATPFDIISALNRYWGFRTLRPLQEQAINAGLEHRDSLVVLPTGGGKSLCYQVPAVVAKRTDIVVSPLISLMKDQVDGLRESGYPAIAMHSGMSLEELRSAEEGIAAGSYHLVFVAPERLVTPRFLHLIDRLGVGAFAIDEAHCISHWGHDFRPEYRQLAELKQRFPRSSVHAYTATATERVRADIITQLQLEDATVLVGTFDRPNLVYRVVPRVNVESQVLQVIQRHADQAAIVYCISRKDCEVMAEALSQNAIRAKHYHAGMEREVRRKTQDEFASEQIDVVVATVAFGMGIDRSDVRCVVHAAMPKSIEHYQQETGRAGRDGLEAECVLFYSAADVVRWENLMGKSALDPSAVPEVSTAARELVAQMRHFSTAVECRHRMLSEHFGQSYERSNCEACDVCLGEVQGVADATVTAQKILSCVARAGERFGVEHIADILLGADTERVRRWQHAGLSTYGLMKGTPRRTLTNLIYQLLDAGLLHRNADERPVLQLNDASWAIMRGQRNVRLLQPTGASVKSSRADEESWEGVDRGLFESLRILRRQMADERGVPPFVLFSDATLRDMARVRPGTAPALLKVRGVGQVKLAQLGERFLSCIGDYCRTHQLPLDMAGDAPLQRKASTRSDALHRAFALFAEGRPVAQVAAAIERAESTTFSYLEQFVATHKPLQLDPWVDKGNYAKIVGAIDVVGTAFLKPVFEHLGGAVPYEQIRLVVAHLQAHHPSSPIPE